MEAIRIALDEPPDRFRARFARAWKEIQEALRGRMVVLKVSPQGDPARQAANAAWFVLAFRAIARSIQVEGIGITGPEPDPAVRAALERAETSPGRTLWICPRCGVLEPSALPEEGGEVWLCPRCRGEEVFSLGRVVYIAPGRNE